jgi:N6-L-threonylcarbamoyladenine synthase
MTTGEAGEVPHTRVACLGRTGRGRIHGGFHRGVVLPPCIEENMPSLVKRHESSAIVKPILGIESSCDETAAAILAGDGRVLAEAVLSQEREHAPYGGVVPEIAARAHLARLPDLVRQVVATAAVDLAGLAAVAASAGPGLIGGLIVGSQFAKGIAIAHRLPYIAVNHLEAHALTARLPGLVEGGAPFPYLLLLVSGGHCACVAVDGVGRYRRLGGTVDDAAGEAFDKVGKLLGLGWPGGPALERLAAEGDPRRFAFPRPMLGREGCDFSFSGLKTAVAQTVARLPPGALPAQLAADVAAGFQAAVTDVLADRASHAMALMRGHASLLVVAGGVAANQAVRRALDEAAAAHGFRLVAPPVRLCTDNAVMVAWAGLERLRLGLVDGIDFAPRPRWPLEALAP